MTAEQEAAEAPRRRGDKQRHAIVQAVRELLEEKPFAELSVSTISDRAGVARSGFYFYFDSKYAVLAHILGEIDPLPAEEIPLDEALDRVATRRVQGAPLFDLQMVQGHVADMALEVDAAALLVYRAAWAKDSGAPRVTREAAMAKLFSTDRAQEVIDRAVQLHGGDGVRVGEKVEELYRDIRALRIYEGASDVQRVIIARQTMGAYQGG